MADLAAVVAAMTTPGALVLHPTETVYGVGGRAGDGLAVTRLATLKGRALGAILVLHPDPPLPGSLARHLARIFWPGPLSIVVPAWSEVAREAWGPGGTVGVRPPVHPLTRALVERVGPITSSSANLTGQPPVTMPSLCPWPLDAVLDAGPLGPAAPSTVVDGVSGRVLREGAIPAHRVVQALEEARGT